MIEPRLKSFLAPLALALALALPAAGMAQDRPDGCVIEAWPAFLDPGPQQHRLREKIPTERGEIYAVEFGPLAGEYAKLYLFLLVYGGCERQAMIVGSYDYLTDIARQNGDIGPTDRRYHIDLVVPQKHNILEYRTSPPGYEEMRARALSVLN